MILAIREMQPPILALILLGACAVKLSRVLRARSVLVVLDATALFPARLRRPATIALCLAEVSLGVGLVITSGHNGVGGLPAADGVRLGTALFFLIGMCALAELRERRPDLGCGCFGELSSKPPGVRSAARAGLLAGAALASIDIRPLAGPALFGLPPPGPAAVRDLGIFIAEVLLLAAVSPEVGEALARLGYTEPCEVRPLSPQRAQTLLERSRAWRKLSPMITSEAPSDVWRELCWCYVVYPARDRGADCEVVFAVEVKAHRPGVHAAVVWSGQDRSHARSASANAASQARLQLSSGF